MRYFCCSIFTLVTAISSSLVAAQRPAVLDPQDDISLVKLNPAARLGALSGVRTFASIASDSILSVTSRATALPTATTQPQGDLLPTTDLSALETSGFERSPGAVIVIREIAATTNESLPFNGMLEDEPYWASALKIVTVTALHGLDSLPLTPTLTPALSVAGVILMLTGVVYALIGIKNTWLV